MKENKETIRKRVLEKRCLINEEERNSRSAAIIKKLFGLDVFNSSNLIMCYVDFNGEVRTAEFIRYCLNIGRRISIPLVMKYPDGRRGLIASEILDFDKDLEKGNFGILEPKKNTVREINPVDIDMVIVPGVAFDLNKNRVGFGAGYYDRFLKMVRGNCHKIGIAFEFQIFDDILMDLYDIPMDMIITENRIL